MLTVEEKEKLEELALAQVGKKYIFGVEVRMDDADPRAFDCSELIQWLYFQIGYAVPDGSYNQFDLSAVTDTAQAGAAEEIQDKNYDTGDLVFCSREPLKVGHVGMVIQATGNREPGTGNDEKKFFVIEARNRKVGVVETTLKEFMGRKSFVGIRRLVLKKLNKNV